MCFTTTKKLLTPFILNVTRESQSHLAANLSIAHKPTGKHNIENNFISLFLLLIQIKTPLKLQHENMTVSAKSHKVGD